MGADPLVLTLWIFLLSEATSGGVISQFDVFQNQEEPACSTKYKDELLYMDCSNRGLAEISSGLDENVNVLNLSNNNFATFPSDIGNHTSLRILDMSENYLSTGYLPAFLENLKDLEILNLSRNNFNTWIGDGRHYRIKILDLSENKIKDVDVSAIVEVLSLTHLDLSENRLNELMPTMFASSISLETLILSKNFFSVVPRFQSQSLKALYLDNCQISNFEVDTFLRMPSLLHVDLSANLIEDIPDNLSSDSLKELDLSYNAISSLSDLSFSSLPHLEVLNLRGNEFREIWPTSYFASNLFLREIQVKGNRWSCEGFSVNLLCTYEFLTKHPPMSDTSSLMCYSPQNVSQMTWLEAYNQTWHSGERISVTMAIIIGVIIGIVLTSFVCRGLMALNKPDPPRPVANATSLNLNGDVPQARAETVVLRIPLQDDLPPTYDEALLMPRLNASFHSLPDFVDEEEEEDRRRYRRSRSIGDLTESRIRAGDRRSVRRAVEIHIN